jgi:ribosomal RNA-processing protein 17
MQFLESEILSTLLREYLTGFRKRKLERQKKAQEELEVQLKAEKKRLKSEVKENLSKLYKLSSRPIPELEEVLKEEEYDTGNVVVKITELSTSELAKENNWIGHNEAYSQPDSDTEVESAGEEEDPEENAVPGMSMGTTKKKVKEEGDEKKADKEKPRPTDIKKEMKQKTAAAMKGSKLVQLKNKLERAKNVKQAKKDRHKKARQFREQQKRHGKSGKKPQGGSAGAGRKKPSRKKK